MVSTDRLGASSMLSSNELDPVVSRLSQNGHGLQDAREHAAQACKCIQKLSAAVCHWAVGAMEEPRVTPLVARQCKDMPLHQYSCRRFGSCGPNLELTNSA